MIRIEVRGTNAHNDTYSIVVEGESSSIAIKEAKRVLGELKFGDYTMWVDSASVAE